MTTIASDGQTIAADSLASDTFTFECPDSKIYFIRGSWVGFCGDVATIEKMREWMEGGAAPQARPQMYGKEVWGALELTEDGRLFMWEGDGRRFAVTVPFAIGSGDAFAMGALRAGATSREAVEIAIELDPYSGGDVVEGRAGVAPGATKKRAKPKKAKRAGSK